MNKNIFFILTIVLSFKGYSQISGKIYNIKTKQPIQYVSVELLDKNKGALSDKLGFFTINSNDISANDSLSLRLIGYQSKKFMISDILNNQIDSFFLVPISYQLPEVNVTSQNNCETTLTGINTKSNGVFFQDVGYQLSVYCKNKSQLKNSVISKVRFKIRNEGKHNAPFRVHIYNILAPKEGFFVAMEWIYTDDSYFYMDELTRKKYRSQKYGQVLGAIESSKLDNYTYIKSLGGKWHKFIFPFLQEEGKSYNALIGAEITICE